jgi:hypothetical protein
LLTHNYKDFNNLHELVTDAGGHHPGVLVVRRDNDPRKDLSPKGIVPSCRLASPSPIACTFSTIGAEETKAALATTHAEFALAGDYE